MQEISNLISTVGFPIVACVFMYKQQIELNKTITELTSTLRSIDTRLNHIEEKNK